MHRLIYITLVLMLLLPATGAHAANPRVVESTIEDGQDDVDPSLTRIRVQFDQPMQSGSWSIVGDGPSFPEIVDKPYWADAKTIVISVKLEPDHEYWLSINSDKFQGFRSRGGEPAMPQPLAFRTRPAGAAPEPAEPLSPQSNREAIDRLRHAIDADYSYRDRLKLDWDALFARYAPAMEAARTANEFARATVKLLREAQDGHVYVRVGERSIGTHFSATAPNYNLQTLRRTVPEWKEHGAGVASGRFAGDIAYLLIPEWSQPVADALDGAFAAVKDAAGLVIDVRMNGGGDETLAQQFAGRFVEEPKAYSRNRIRRNGQWSGPFDRVIRPRPVDQRYRGPVAVLMGPKVGSSCESFVLMMKHARRCTLVGDATKGSSGNPRPHELGNGVTVVLSSWEDQLPDGTVLEGHGVKPEVAVEVAPEQLRERDIVLETALRQLPSTRLRN